MARTLVRYQQLVILVIREAAAGLRSVVGGCHGCVDYAVPK
jgi:hypothetical protein